MVFSTDILSEDYRYSVYMAEKRYRRRQVLELLAGPLVSAGVCVLLLGAIAWSIPTAQEDAYRHQWQTIICYEGVPMEAIYGDSEDVETFDMCIVVGEPCFAPDGMHDHSPEASSDDEIALDDITMSADYTIKCDFGRLEKLRVGDPALERTETLADVELAKQTAAVLYPEPYYRPLAELYGMGISLAAPYEWMARRCLSTLTIPSVGR